jgi:hypothetical protein
VAFMTAYNIKMLVSGYHSVDMHCIVLTVKFDNELFIPVLINKQLYKIMEIKKFTLSKVQKNLIFQIPPF